MDVFKRFPYIKESILISEKNFSEYTKKAKPYYSSVNGIGKYYAVCPGCDGPIQICGYFKNTEEAGRKSYGRHVPHSVPEIAVLQKNAKEENDMIVKEDILYGEKAEI